MPALCANRGLNVLIDPNFARWLFLLKRLRQPGLRIVDLPPIDLVLVTHAHFDHLHRPSLRAIARRTEQLRGKAPLMVIRNMFTTWCPISDIRVWWNWTGGAAISKAICKSRTCLRATGAPVF